MSTPAKSIPISRGRAGNDAQDDSVSQTPVGTPDLRALRAGYVGTPPPPNIPPRSIPTPSLPVSSSPALSSSLRPISGGIPASMSSSAPRIAGTSSGAAESSDEIQSTKLEDLDPEEKAKVLRRHLVSKDERTKPCDSGELDVPPTASDEGTSTSGRSSSHRNVPPTLQREDSDAFPIPYHAQGADITHDIYKWQSNHQRKNARNRAASLANPRSGPSDPAFEHIHEPGGFRRNYVLTRLEGTEEPRILNNFIDFLFIFGHFAGEDLEEDLDDEGKENEEEIGDANAIAAGLEAGEQTPLLQSSRYNRSRSRSRRRAMSSAADGPHGNATVTQAVLMLLKSFVGTGVLFLSKAFYNGGILFSSLLFTFIAAISLYSFILLVKTKFVVSGSFGDMGGALYGAWMRNLILISIIVSQLGFVGAYTIFVSENLRSFVLGVTHCATSISVHYFILMQLVVLLPLALVRDLAKLSTTALIADVFILAGLIYIFGSEFLIIASRGVQEVRLFNPKDFPLFVGTAVFSFEGIGLVIPITDAMREPHKFPKVLSGVMVFLLLLFGGAGVLGYLTFGSHIQTVILVNLDTSSKMVQAVQFLYSLAIMLSIPLQLFPAIRILENWVFVKSGKRDTRIKWSKNLFRFGIVMVTTVISWVGASDLDKFVAFIGCFACVPLCYVYPAMLHYRACAFSKKDKAKDMAMIVFGLIAAAYTTVQTVRLILEPSTGGPPLESC